MWYSLEQLFFTGHGDLIPPSDFEQTTAAHVASTPRGRLNVREQADQTANASHFLSTTGQPAHMLLPPMGTERYVNEALTRQAVQIAELHEEIRRLESERLREKLMCDNELSMQRTHFEARLSALQVFHHFIPSHQTWAIFFNSAPDANLIVLSSYFLTFRLSYSRENCQCYR